MPGDTGLIIVEYTFYGKQQALTSPTSFRTKKLCTILSSPVSIQPMLSSLWGCVKKNLQNNRSPWCPGWAPKTADFWMEMSAERFTALLCSGCQRGHVCVSINRIYGTIAVNSSALILNVWHRVQVEFVSARLPGAFCQASLTWPETYISEKCTSKSDSDKISRSMHWNL